MEDDFVAKKLAEFAGGDESALNYLGSLMRHGRLDVETVRQALKAHLESKIKEYESSLYLKDGAPRARVTLGRLERGASVVYMGFEFRRLPRRVSFTGRRVYINELDEKVNESDFIFLSATILGDEFEIIRKRVNAIYFDGDEVRTVEAIEEEYNRKAKQIERLTRKTDKLARKMKKNQKGAL